VVPPSHRDLLTGPLTAAVTTIGADGYPQTSAIWFMWEDDRLWFSTKRWAAKYRNVLRRPQVGFLVVDPADEFRYVELRGTATVADDSGCVGRDRIRAKHGVLGAPDPAAADRVLVVVTPHHVVVHP
jgi:PPOX class probable F420-dependent enzyme